MEGFQALRGLLFIWFVGLLVARYRRRKKRNLPFWTGTERVAALLIYLVAFLLTIGLMKNWDAERLGRATFDIIVLLSIFVGIPYLLTTGSRDKRRFAATVQNEVPGAKEGQGHDPLH
jgi:hypothetical protein